MKTTIYSLLVILLLCIHMLACKEKVGEIPPTIAPVTVTGVSANSAKVSSAITKAGNQQIIEHGITLSESETAAEIADPNVKKGSIDRTTPTPISFDGSFANLKPSTVYYARAFAILESGPVFTPPVKFSTTNIVQAVVKTDGAEGITFNFARLKGSITAKGTYPISEYGLVWSGSANPTTSSSSKHTIKGDVTQIPTQFSVDANGLVANTTYHFRAYAISNGITTYGADLTFNTSGEVQPVVETGDAKPSDKSSYLEGQINQKGTSAISQYGICWSTEANPTVSGAKFVIESDINEVPKKFSGTAENLNPNMTYHYRAFATMNGVTSYGADKTFSTGTNAPGIITGDVTNLETFSVTLLGRIGSAGSFPVSEIGMVWSSNTNAPAIGSNTKVSKSAVGIPIPHDFNFMISGLDANVLYYYRAYAISNGQVTYGVTKAFKTKAISLPTVNTLSNYDINVKDRVFTFYGNVTKVGTYPITKFGFTYSEGGTAYRATDAQEVVQTFTTPRSNAFLFTNNVPIHRCLVMYYKAFVIDSKGTRIYGQQQSIDHGPCIN